MKRIRLQSEGAKRDGESKPKQEQQDSYTHTLAQLNQLWKDRACISKLAAAAHDAGKMEEYRRLNSELLRLDGVYKRMKAGLPNYCAN